MPLPSQATQLPPARPSGKAVMWLTLLGAYLNAAVFGFMFFPANDYNVLLPLMNWIRDPSLYKGDVAREGSSPYLIMFWWIVARLSRYFSVEHILFVVFLLTKLLFFYAVSRLVLAAVRSRALCACIVSAIALSGLLNTSPMPFGASNVLSDIQTHYAFGFALLLLAGVLLTEGCWWWAVILAGAGVYMDALVFLFTLPAFGLFALADWKEHKWRIVGAGFLGAVLTMPWLLLSRQSVQAEFPPQFLSALFAFYPWHFTLRWTPVTRILKGVAILIATVWMALLARRLKSPSYWRFEILTASYLIPLALGILFGNFDLLPSMVRMHLMRADSYLFTYAFLLILIYAAGLLESADRRFPLTALSLGIPALVFPLAVSVGTAPIFLGLLLEWDPRKRFENFARKVTGSMGAWLSRIPVRDSAAAICGIAILSAFVITVPRITRLWDFAVPLTPRQSACVDLQLWMKSHTAVKDSFLVPTAPCGFRIFSERGTWGEWSDGNVMIARPHFATIFRERLVDLGLPTDRPLTEVEVEQHYEKLPWQTLVGIAQKHHLDYIVQYKSASYDATPVYDNREYALYRVPADTVAGN